MMKSTRLAELNKKYQSSDSSRMFQAIAERNGLYTSDDNRKRLNDAMNILASNETQTNIAHANAVLLSLNCYELLG